MAVFPLSVLALAAGVYLLIKTNREYLGGIFKFFSWLIIVLALASITAGIARGVHHYRMRHCGQCNMHERMMIKEFRKCDMDGPAGCPMMAGKAQGDSVVLDKAVCEKIMGKEECEKMCKERGQCIMTRDECAKMCGAKALCSGEAKDCCKSEPKECCKGSETKACCKKQ
jgi:hypothetical protein